MKHSNEIQIIFNFIRGLAGWSTFDVSEHIYQGVFAGSEYLTYDADKLYVALNLKMSTSNSSDTNAQAVKLYNHNDNVMVWLRNNSIAYDGVNINYSMLVTDISNCWFSRLEDVSAAERLMFLGYRLDKT